MQNIVVVDDDAGVAETVLVSIGQRVAFSRGSVVSTFREAVEFLPSSSPDIVVLDNRLTDGCGLDLLRHFKGALPKTRWLMYSSYLSKITLQRAVSFGVDGAVSKRAPLVMLLEAIGAVLEGRHYFCSISAYELARCDGDRLTRTERIVAQHISSGLTPKEIAAAMGVAYKTVLNSLVTLRIKIGANSFVQISDYAREHGLSKLDGN